MHPVQALFEVLKAHLVSPAWNDAFPVEVVPADFDRPYVAFFQSGGGRDRLAVGVRTYRYSVTVKCVADELAAALAGAEAISGLLDNSGTQDIKWRLPSHPDWEITTVSEDGDVVLDEQFQGAVAHYHRGQIYVVTMEVKP